MYQRHVFPVNDGAVVCMTGLQAVQQGLTGFSLALALNPEGSLRLGFFHPDLGTEDRVPQTTENVVCTTGSSSKAV